MGQIGGPSIWLLRAARFWLLSKSVRQSMVIIFSPEVTLAFFQYEYYVFLDKAFPISSWYFVGILCSICGLMV
jgi:hypothetical protein